MSKGVYSCLLFYGIGYGLASVLYLIFGYTYIHAPGIHHITILLTLIIGLSWLLVNIYALIKDKNAVLKDHIIANSIILFISLVYLFNFA